MNLKLPKRDVLTLLCALTDATSDRESFEQAYTRTDYGTKAKLNADDAKVVQRTRGLIKRYARLDKVLRQQLREHRQRETD